MQAIGRSIAMVTVVAAVTAGIFTHAGVMDRDRLRDGTCVAGTGLHDGSGKYLPKGGSQTTERTGRVALDSARLRDGTGDGVPDRLRDGSCAL